MVQSIVSLKRKAILKKRGKKRKRNYPTPIFNSVAEDSKPSYERANTDIESILIEGFTTKYGGLFALAPFIKLLDIPSIFDELGIDRGDGIPATNLLLTLISLKCSGISRYSHANDIREDRGISILAGLSKLPDQSLLHTFSGTLSEEKCQSISVLFARLPAIPSNSSIARVPPVLNKTASVIEFCTDPSLLKQVIKFNILDFPLPFIALKNK